MPLHPTNRYTRTKSASRRALERSGVTVARFALLAALATGVTKPARADEEASRAAVLSGLVDEAAVLVAQPEFGVTSWARISYLAARIFSYGADAVPDMRRHFTTAATPEIAFLSGAYVAVYGNNEDHLALRTQLETDPAKRVWLRHCAGDANALAASLRRGERWKRAVELLPSPGSCRHLINVLLLSRDPLVRRSGLLWGHWIPDAGFWRRTRIASESDPDPLTRQLAASLIRTRTNP